ncbi:MAG: hypothetical protein ACR2JI_09415 [Mycobacterium sp.]
MTRTAGAVPRLTDRLLAGVTGIRRAVITPTEDGVVAGTDALRELAADSRFGDCEVRCSDGQSVAAGEVLAEIIGTAIELAAAEDAVLGPLGFAGGVARRCHDIVESAPMGLRIVCGGWKKLPAALKPLLRAGLDAGGVGSRLVDGDFVYIDKNVVRLLGGVPQAVAAGALLDNGRFAVQVDSPDGALAAVHAGAGIIMDDTGDLSVLASIDTALRECGMRDDVVLAFAGGVRPEQLSQIRECGADVVDLGRAIIDAPLWDLHLVVQP